MEAAFWHARWANNEIAFHEDEVNPLLIKHFKLLALPQHGVVFVPLCGKTLDIGWLRSAGYTVIGAELSEAAVSQLFAELGATPNIKQLDKLKHYQADGISIYVGDIFDLSSNMLGCIDAVFDRAALVALPSEMRMRYSEHLKTITATAPQLLQCVEYDQSVMPGPPFAIDKDEVSAHYASAYNIQFVDRKEIEGGLKGRCKADDVLWLLQPKR